MASETFGSRIRGALAWTGDQLHSLIAYLWDWDLHDPWHEGEPFFFGALFAVVSATSLMRVNADQTWIVGVPEEPVATNIILEALVDAGATSIAIFAAALAAGLVSWTGIVLRILDKWPRPAAKVAVIAAAIQTVLSAGGLVSFLTLVTYPQKEWWWNNTYFAAIEAIGAGTISTCLFLIDVLYLHIPLETVTVARRKLIFAALGAMSYLVLMALVFEHVEPGWDFSTAFIFSAVTSCTIGYGQNTTRTVAGQILLFFLGPIGIGLIGFLLFSIRDNLLESARENMKRLVVRRRLSRQLGRDGDAASILSGVIRGERRYSAASELEGYGGMQELSAVPGLAEAKLAEEMVERNQYEEQDAETESVVGDSATALEPGLASYRDVDPDRDSNVESDLESAERVDGGTGQMAVLERGKHASQDSMFANPITLRMTLPDATAGQPGFGVALTAGLSRTLTIDPATLFTPEEARQERRRIEMWSIARIGVIFLIYWFIGGVLFYVLEPPWDYLEGLYFAWSTLTTVGYGDLVCIKPACWEWWLYFVYIEVALFAYLIALVGDLINQRMDTRLERTVSRDPRPKGGGTVTAMGTAMSLMPRVEIEEDDERQ
ncbi:hypothetical protein DFJ74DRAFT_704721 [Hyaloraphidium curvatum]|nr:hypothetical protein DFJ74DRAFT_704721 [Hyaloraphidium curvatum]